MQRAVIGFLPVLFFLLSIGTASAQNVFPTPTPTPTPKPSPTGTPGPAPCPTVNVQAQPSQPVRDGQRVSFAANIAGGDPKVVPMIIWNTSGGSITQGHNTRRIEVDTTGAGSTDYREVKADVWVGGYAPECLLQASGSVKIIGPAVKFGEFGEVDDQTLQKNIEAVSTFLSQSPDNLYLIAYAGRNSERGFAYNWLKRLKDAIVAAGISSRRITGVDGGFREEPLFDFWIVPIGAEPPRPAPTVKRSEIVYPNTRPPRRP
ncbi:MAG TPA: hypothetical protein VFZ23_14410 [Pyrinomonadaceae bacterium]